MVWKKWQSSRSSTDRCVAQGLDGLSVTPIRESADSVPPDFSQIVEASKWDGTNAGSATTQSLLSRSTSESFQIGHRKTGPDRFEELRDVLGAPFESSSQHKGQISHDRGREAFV